MVNPFRKIRDWFAVLPDKKKYIEVITASLSIPVLLSVVLINYLNIQERRSNDKITSTITEAPKDQSPTIITIIKEPDQNATPTPTIITSPTQSVTKEECIKDIGPISIATPEENEAVTSNPLEINIQYDQGEYCSVVWSYRINNGNWSNFIDNDIFIYNMDSGQKTIELHVKSIVSNASKTIRRTFTYENAYMMSTPTITPTPPSRTE